MREVITIKTPTLNTDSNGGNYTTYSETDYRGTVEEQSIQKQLQDGGVLFYTRYTVRLRNGGIVPNITEEYKFVWRGTELEIQQKRTTQNRAYREFECTAKNN